MGNTVGKLEEKIGPYRLIRLIAKGGMGEVFLAYDPDCKREIALKCIRSEYLDHQIIYKRFVKEAFIASHLTHPNIIPIYALSKEHQRPYYTMPYIEGKNLKKILVETLEHERSAQNVGASIGSIESLTHIFLTICQAVSYAHSQQIIHRDLKPENILIGRYGEVLIFDWGVADKIQNIAKEDPSYAIEELEFPNLTSPGKIIGTLSFLAPERFKGEPADYQTDIYSLGVMLYTILTLKLPFRRKNLKEIKKTIDREVLKNPIEVAPYRDIPHALVNITQKCLAVDRKERYRSMSELLEDLNSFVKGKSEWIQKDKLFFMRKEDWGFHENVLVSKNQAISQRPEACDWVSVMLSKLPYAPDARIEFLITLQKGSKGVGLMVNANQSQKGIHVIDGYDVWLSAQENEPSQLSRNNIVVLTLPSLKLKPYVQYKLLFEQIGNRIRLEINGAQQFSYLSYLSLQGKHVGLIYRDTLFEVTPLSVLTASPSLITSCLKVPDVFFQNHLFDLAYSEYHRIAHAFPGRHESREAFFRAGLSLLKKGEQIESKEGKERVFDRALEEFENLKSTPGAPLEYLGKAFVYHADQNLPEELKCLELSILKYPKHPLLYLIYEHIIYRMHESSHECRIATYEFILLALRYNAYAERKQMIDFLLLNLAEKRKGYFFFTPLGKEASEKDQFYRISIHISFLLGKTQLLKELYNRCLFHLTNQKDTSKEDAADFAVTDIEKLQQNILIALWLLDEKELFPQFLEQTDEEKKKLFSLLSQPPSEDVFHQFLTLTPPKLSSWDESILFIMMDKALLHKAYDALRYIFEGLREEKNPLLQNETLEKFSLEYSIVTRDFQSAQAQVLKNRRDASELHFDQHFLEGCLIYGTRGQNKALEFFSEDLESSHPHLDRLGSLYLTHKLNFETWSKSAFRFELVTLYRQLYLFYKSSQNHKKAERYHELWKSHAYY